MNKFQAYWENYKPCRNIFSEFIKFYCWGLSDIEKLIALKMGNAYQIIWEIEQDLFLIKSIWGKNKCTLWLMPAVENIRLSPDNMFAYDYLSQLNAWYVSYTMLSVKITNFIAHYIWFITYALCNFECWFSFMCFLHISYIIDRNMSICTVTQNVFL